MDVDQSTSVAFEEIPQITWTLSVTNSGSGPVTSSPDGISILSAGTSDSGTFDDGTVVTLAAAPDEGWRVESWGGVCSGASTTCEVTMDADQSASVAFEEGVPDLINGESTNALAGTSGEQLFFRLPVPSGASSLRVELEGGSGEADLFVRRDVLPTNTSYDCRPFIVGNDESCNFGSPSSGEWFLACLGSQLSMARR